MILSIELIVLLTITGLCSVIFACASRVAAPIFFIGVIFASSISSPMESGISQALTWIGPIQTYRSYIFIAASGLLLLNLVVQPRRLRPTAAPASASLMVMVGLLMGLLMAVQGDPIQGVLTAGAAMISLGATILLLTQARDYRSGFFLFASCVFATSCIINAVISLQFLVNPNAMLSSEWSRRFQGLTGNPQFFGAQLAIVTAILAWLLINVRRKVLWAMLVPIIGMNSLFLIWTGSRTGLGMFVIGLSIVMFSRFKRAAVALPIIALGFAVAYKLVGRVLSDIDTSRLTSLENTRQGAWTRLIEVYVQNPLIGAGFEDGEVDKSENSLLYGMAAYGTGMGLLYFVTAIATVVLVYKLYRLRGSVDAATKGMIDLVIAVNAAFFAGTVLEGYFIARVNVLIILFVSINVVGYQLIRQARTAEDEQSLPRSQSGLPASPMDVESCDSGQVNYAELAFP